MPRRMPRNKLAQALERLPEHYRGKVCYWVKLGSLYKVVRSVEGLDRKMAERIVRKLGKKFVQGFLIKRRRKPRRPGPKTPFWRPFKSSRKHSPLYFHPKKGKVRFWSLPTMEPHKHLIHRETSRTWLLRAVLTMPHDGDWRLIRGSLSGEALTEDGRRLIYQALRNHLGRLGYGAKGHVRLRWIEKGLVARWSDVPGEAAPIACKQSWRVRSGMNRTRICDRG